MFDRYTKRARAVPAILAGLPLVVLAVCSGVQVWGAAGLASTLIVAPLLALGSGIARDQGRRIQLDLARKWGGLPTLQAMRWNGNDAEEVAERHRVVGAVANRSLPDLREEQVDPKGADAKYRKAIERVRIEIRESPDFGILHDAVTEYGLRRNCLGLRKKAMLLAAATGIFLLVISGSAENPGVFQIGAAVCFALVLIWGYAVSEGWVSTAAERYSEAFFQAATKAADRNG